jgi:hypothetical protein
MTTYKALLREIAAVQTARDSLPSDTHIGALFDLTLRRLWEHAEAAYVPSDVNVWDGPVAKSHSEVVRRVTSSSFQFGGDEFDRSARHIAT